MLTTSSKTGLFFLPEVSTLCISKTNQMSHIKQSPFYRRYKAYLDRMDGSFWYNLQDITRNGDPQVRSEHEQMRVFYSYLFDEAVELLEEYMYEKSLSSTLGLQYPSQFMKHGSTFRYFPMAGTAYDLQSECKYAGGVWGFERCGFIQTVMSRYVSPSDERLKATGVEGRKRLLSDYRVVLDTVKEVVMRDMAEQLHTMNLERLQKYTQVFQAIRDFPFLFAMSRFGPYCEMLYWKDGYVPAFTIPNHLLI